jgi:hypothetical protein
MIISCGWSFWRRLSLRGRCGMSATLSALASRIAVCALRSDWAAISAVTV